MEENDSYVDFSSVNSSISCYNLSENEDLARNYLHSDFDILLQNFLLPVILSVGIVTNCAFLFVVYRVPSMRTVVNQYLTHIAVADLLFLITAIGKKILKFSVTKNRYGTFWPHWMALTCHLINYTTIFASVLIMTLVGFERFYAVCRPMRIYAASNNQRMVKVLLAIVWSLSGSLALTTIPAMSKIKEQCIIWPDTPEFEGISITFETYYPYSNATMAYVALVQTVPFFVVMGINSVLYVRMVTTMSSRLGTMQAHDLDTHTNVELRNKVAVMLIINGVTFFTLTFPFQFVSFVNGIFVLVGKDGDIGSEFKTLFQILLYCNSLVNPIIYNAANSRYRSAFVTAFGIDKVYCMDFACSLRPRRYNTPINNGNARESPTKNTITTTYSNSYTTNVYGDILLEGDTKC